MNDDTERSRFYSHYVMEQIKISVTLDGDLAMSLANVVAFAAEHHFLDDLIFCEYTLPKMNKFMELLNEELDVENRDEK